jgi:hypothetical protein
MRTILFFVAMFVAAHQSIAAQQTTLRIAWGLDNSDVFTFDQSRVSPSEVKHWFKFAENGYYGTFGISLSGCDKGAALRLEKDLGQAKDVIDELDHEAYPSELAPVVAYLKRELRFRLWLGEQYLQFAKTRIAPQSAYEHENQSCRRIVEEIGDESDRTGACERLGNEWTQCVLKQESRDVGSYPKRVWKEFLNSRGITEQLMPSGDDD